MPVAVNLSAQEFRQRDVVKEVAQALADTGLDACYLHIELTETTLMLSGNQMQQTLHALKPWAWDWRSTISVPATRLWPICASTP
jgi:EAL domain-containing protein (putative c-di-GMP-specific phosphodiesterase class I)